MPSNIAYPTDVSLLEKVRQKAVQYLETAKEFGAKTYRTYKERIVSVHQPHLKPMVRGKYPVAEDCD